MRWIFTALLFLYASVCVADPIWVDEPIAYKRYFQVQTFLIEGSGMFGPIGYYVTYVFDTRPEAANTARYILYCVYTAVESHARIAHQSANDWLRSTHAHLRVNTELDNYRNIGTPAAPSNRNARAFDYTSQQNQTMPPRARSEPTSKRQRTELEVVIEETTADLKSSLMDEKGSGM